jgi:hypothetical protein
MLQNKPVKDWAEIMEKADLPSNYYITFAAILSTVFSLVLPWVLT